VTTELSRGTSDAVASFPSITGRSCVELLDSVEVVLGDWDGPLPMDLVRHLKREYADRCAELAEREVRDVTRSSIVYGDPAHPVSPKAGEDPDQICSRLRFAANGSRRVIGGQSFELDPEVAATLDDRANRECEEFRSAMRRLLAAWHGWGSVDECTIFGTHGPDVISGTDGDDVICGGAGDDVIDARGGNDSVFPGPGDDTVNAGPGNDKVSSWGASYEQEYDDDAGNDTIDLGPGSDIVDSGAGNDIVTAGPGIDFVATHGGDDILIGSEGRNHLTAGDGNDVLYGVSNPLANPLDSGTIAQGGPGSDLGILLDASNDLWWPDDFTIRVELPNTACGLSVDPSEFTIPSVSRISCKVVGDIKISLDDEANISLSFGQGRDLLSGDITLLTQLRDDTIAEGDFCICDPTIRLPNGAIILRDVL